MRYARKRSDCPPPPFGREAQIGLQAQADRIKWILDRKREGYSHEAIALAVGRAPSAIDALVKSWGAFVGAGVLPIRIELHRRATAKVERKALRAPANAPIGIIDAPIRLSDADDLVIAALHRAHGGFEDVRFRQR